MNEQPASQTTPLPMTQGTPQQPKHLGTLRAIYAAIVFTIITLIAVPIIYVANLSAYESVREDEARAYCTHGYSKNNNQNNKYDDCYRNYLTSAMSARTIDSVIPELMGSSAIIFVCLIAFIIQMGAKTKVNNAIIANSPTIANIKGSQVAIIVVGVVVFLLNFIILNLTQCIDRCTVNTAISVFTNLIMETNSLAGFLINVCLTSLYVIVTLIMPIIILSLASSNRE